jgi:hypothetical protein
MRVIAKQHLLGLEIASARHEEHAFSSLGKKRARVHGAIRPTITAFFKSRGQVVHGCALVELQHEGNVLKHDHWNAFAIQKAKHVVD